MAYPGFCSVGTKVSLGMKWLGYEADQWSHTSAAHIRFDVHSAKFNIHVSDIFLQVGCLSLKLQSVIATVTAT